MNLIKVVPNSKRYRNNPKMNNKNKNRKHREFSLDTILYLYV